jgi:hypothetical protein
MSELYQSKVSDKNFGLALTLVEFGRTALCWIGAIYCIALILGQFSFFASTHPSANSYFPLYVGLAGALVSFISRAATRRVIGANNGVNK